MADIIQIRRDTAANWLSVNPILAQGELGVETDTEKMKIGDGISTWTALGYFITTQGSVGITGGTIDGTVIGGSSAAAGSFTTISASGEIAANGGVAFGDNDKATFGASDDLQIYHDGSHSWIKDVGTGDLTIQGDNLYLEKGDGTKFLYGVSSTGQVRLYYGDAQKFITTATGIDVTGTVTADGLNIGTPNDLNSAQVSVAAADNAFIEVENKTTQLTAGFMWTNTGTKKWTLEKTGASHNLFLQNSAGTTSVQFHQNNDISFYEDTGTTAKFFWDASAESLGIGTTTTTAKLNVAGDSVDGSQVRVTGGTNENYQLRLGFDTANLVSKIQSIHVGTAYRDLSLQPDGGNVGIGTTSPATSLDVAGTVTADGLTVSSSAASSAIAGLYNTDTLDGNGVYINGGGSNSGKYSLLVQNAANVSVLQALASGDFSLYNTAGTTKFFWDASAESLGIGTTSPWETLSIPFDEKLSFGSSAYPFSISRTAYGQLVTTFEDGYDVSNARIDFKMRGGAVTPLSLLGSGNVGIGTTNPLYKLVVSTGGASGIEFGPAYSGTANLVQHYSRSGGVYVDAVNDAAQHRFNISGSEAARLDSSGNLLVGTTDGTPYASNVKGVAIYQSGAISGSVDGLPAGYFNRKTSDGEIVNFRKDGIPVGSIGSYSGAEIFITGGTTYNSGVVIGDRLFVPCTANGNAEDGLTDIGSSARRFKDLYLSGAVINNTTTTATSKTLVNGEQCVVTAATQTLTLPASPSTGDNVSIFVGAFTDTVIGRNGSNIMGLAEDLTIDSQNIGIKLIYIDATNGWRII